MSGKNIEIDFEEFWEAYDQLNRAKTQLEDVQIKLGKIKSDSAALEAFEGRVKALEMIVEEYCSLLNEDCRSLNMVALKFTALDAVESLLFK